MPKYVNLYVFRPKKALSLLAIADRTRQIPQKLNIVATAD
jgi:hypothetical protein